MFAGRSSINDKRIDIAIYSDSSRKKFDFIIEVKRPEVKDINQVYGIETTSPKEQMISYCSFMMKSVQVMMQTQYLF